MAKKAVKKGAKKPARRTVPKKPVEITKKRKPGRPTTYTEKLGDRVCAELAGGKSLVKVCLLAGMPSRETIYAWLRTHKEFSDNYAIACQARAQYLAEETLEIADSLVPKVNTQFGRHMDAAAVNDKRLRVDTRKWFASKLDSKNWGDKITQEHQGPGGGPIPVANVAPADYAAVKARLEKHAAQRSSSGG